MKTLKTTITALFAFMGMILIQGCLWGSGGLGGSSYTPDRTYTTTTYQFDPEEYFSNQDYKSNRPFYMSGGNLSSPLLNTKESPYGSGKHNRFSFSGDFKSSGYNFRTAFKPWKRMLVMAGISSTSDQSTSEGWVSSVPVTIKSVTAIAGNPFNTYSSSSSGKKNLPYQMENYQTQSEQEIAIGYYDFIGSQGVWEVFAGFGNGVAENSYSYQFGDASTEVSESNHFQSTLSEERNFYKLFLQNTIGFSTNLAEASIGARLTYLEFTKQELTNNAFISSYEFKPTAFLAEPVIHFGIGVWNFKLFSEYAFAIPLSDSDVEWNKGKVKFGALLKF